MSKVILVNGSPHATGCTFTALAEIAGVLEANGVDTEIIHIGVKPISGCIACGKCRENGKCVFDDVVNEFAKRAIDADGIVFGSPVHYAAISGGLSSFMDRLFYAYGRNFRGKPVAGIVSCRRGGSTAALDQLHKYFSISGMPIVTGSYWNMVHGNTPDEVKKDEEGLHTMRGVATNMAWLIKCIDTGKTAGVTLPVAEPKVWTNFIKG